MKNRLAGITQKTGHSSHVSSSHFTEFLRIFLNFRHNTTSAVASLNMIFYTMSTKNHDLVFFYFLPKYGVLKDVLYFPLTQHLCCIETF